MIGAQFVHDHVMHFYYLHALDSVDVVSALKADPKATSALAQSISAYAKSSPGYYAEAQKKLRSFVESGQLGIFANGYWGHPEYKLPPEANLMAVAHYLDGLVWLREVAKLHAIFGAKNPHPNFLVGGAPAPISASPIAGAGDAAATAVNVVTLSEARQIIRTMQAFVDEVYLPDTLAIASFYKDWFRRGEGVGNFLTYGEFPLSGKWDSKRALSAGVIVDRDLSHIEPIDLNDPDEVQEFVSHSWYDYSAGKDAGLHPYVGETALNYDGPKPPYRQLDVDKGYSWLKAPRWRGKAVEVGPLARVLMLYAAGHEPTMELAGFALKKLDLPIDAPYSTLGRTAARTLESKIIADQMEGWLDALIANVKGGDVAGREMGAVHLAEQGQGRRLHGGAARRARALDRHPRRPHRQLSGGRADDLERRPARPDGPARPLRGRARRPPPPRRAEAAARDPAHHPIVRPLHRLRGARRRSERRAAGQDRGEVSPGSPSSGCWGRGRAAPDGVWPAASTQVALRERHREPPPKQTRLPHPKGLRPPPGQAGRRLFHASRRRGRPAAAPGLDTCVHAAAAKLGSFAPGF